MRKKEVDYLALSGAFTSAVTNWIDVRLEWSATQNRQNNTSTVTARLYLVSKTAATTIVASQNRTATITIDGSSNSVSTNFSLRGNEKKQIHSWSRTINHNANGSKSLTISGTAAFAGLPITGVPKYDYTAGGSATLNTIPRASTLASAANWTAGSNLSINVNRATTSFTHTVRIYVGNMSSPIRTDTGIAATRTIAFTQAQNNTIFTRLAQGASIATKIELDTFSGSSKIGSTSTKTGTVTAPAASTATYPSTLNIGAVLSGSIARNNSGFVHNIRMYRKSDNLVLGQVATGAGGSYSFDTSTIASALYGATPNSTTLPVYIRVWTMWNGSGGIQVRGHRDYNISLRVVNSNPVFSGSFTYVDTNATTIAVTGDNKKIIQNNSNLSVTIPAASRATAVNGATMKTYSITIANRTKSLNYSTGALTTSMGTIDASGNVSLTITATDSRNLKTARSVTVPVIAYRHPSISAEVERYAGFETETTINANGSYSRILIDGVDKNSPVEVSYRVKRTNTTSWGSYIPLDVVMGAGNYRTEEREDMLNNEMSFNVQVRVKDKLREAIENIEVPIGRPLLFIDSERSSMGFNDFPANENEFLVNGRLVLGGGDWTSNTPHDSGAMNINASGKVMKINYPEGRHGYIEFSEDDTRQGYMGFSDDKVDFFSIRNQKDPDNVGSIYLGKQDVNFRNTTATYNGVPVFSSDEKIIWEGAYYMSDTQSINPGKTLAQCPNGWILVWSRYADGQAHNDNWSFNVAPKSRVEIGGGGGVQFSIGTENGAFSKYIYYTNTTITGHTRNNTAPHNTRVLRYVLSY